MSAGDWINLVALVLGIAGSVAGFVHCSLPDVGISLADSRLNPAEYDDPSAEYVCLINSDDRPVSLAGWELHSAERRINVLPDLTLQPAAAVRVHPGEGSNSTADLYGEKGSPQWRNDGGQITLYDSAGEEIDSVGYGERKQGDGSGECGSGGEVRATKPTDNKPPNTSNTPSSPQPPNPPPCDPNYRGACLDPNASDYDCAGGEGDGPEYVEGPVEVVGEDRFGLDSNGDGIGC